MPRQIDVDPTTGFASLRSVEGAFWEGIRPDPVLTVSEWSERFRQLSAEASSEAGAWQNARTPYLVEIMDALSPQSRVEEIVFMKSAQIGGTECGNNWIAYIVARGLGPTLAVQGTIGLAERYSKQRLEPMFRDTPAIRAKVKDRRVRDSGNTILQKTFDGGTLMLAGSESAKGLRMMPIRNLFLDEIDSYPDDVEGEGDPVKLAMRRTSNFPRRKVLLVSTPTRETSSKIAAAYRDSDQRVYLVPCPHCGHEQRLQWAGLQYETDEEQRVVPASVYYQCEECEGRILERHKRAMLLAGRWQPTAEEPTGLRRGYHISALYSPWFAWWRVAREWVEAQAHPERLVSFVNTLLGETWKEVADTPEWRQLYARRESWRQGTVPMGGHVLTAGVDVQRDRLELEVVAWGPRMESWSVEFVVLEGDPAAPAVWEKLEGYLSRTWPHESGAELRLARLAIDSGDQAQLVYSWARRFPEQVMAVKGGPDGMTEILGRPKMQDIRADGKRVRRGAKLWMVGSGTIKHEFYAWLRLPPPTDEEEAPRGFVHFPADREAEWFEQLCGEAWVRERDRRTKRYRWRWVKTRERNEALDCRVYARAALSSLGADRWEPEAWAACLSTWGLDSGPVGHSGPADEGGSADRPAGYLARHQGGRYRIR